MGEPALKPGDKVSNPLVRGGRARSLFGNLKVADPNPDEVARGRGGIRAYLPMLQDPYVKTAYGRKISETLELDYLTTPASDSPEHQTHARFVDWVFANLKGSLYEDLAQMCSAILAGYSITEKVWEAVEEGQWTGKWRVAALKTKDCRDFGFKLDEFRNVAAVVTEVTNPNGGSDPQTYDPALFVILSWMSLFENPYGTSDFQAAYRPYFILKNLWVARAKYLERFAHPTPEGEYEDGATDEEIDEFQESLEALMDESVIVHSSRYKINFLEAATDGAAYESAQQRLSTEILIAILGGHLNVIEGGLQGAKAQGEVHQASTAKGSEWVRVMLESAINEQLVVPLIKVNFGPQDAYPVWGFDRGEKFDYQNALALRQVTEVLSWCEARNIPYSQEFVRETFRIPAPKYGETQVVPPQGDDMGRGGMDETDRIPDPDAPMLSDFADLSVSGAAQRNIEIQMRNLARSEALAHPRWTAAMRGYRNDLARELQKKRHRGRS